MTNASDDNITVTSQASGDWNDNKTWAKKDAISKAFDLFVFKRDINTLNAGMAEPKATN